METLGFGRGGARAKGSVEEDTETLMFAGVTPSSDATRTWKESVKSCQELRLPRGVARGKMGALALGVTAVR